MLSWSCISLGLSELLIMSVNIHEQDFDLALCCPLRPSAYCFISFKCISKPLKSCQTPTQIISSLYLYDFVSVIGVCSEVSCIAMNYLAMVGSTCQGVKEQRHSQKQIQSKYSRFSKLCYSLCTCPVMLLMSKLL